MLIGAIVITEDGDEGMIVDKVLSYSNQSNYTKYVIINNDRSVKCVAPSDIVRLVEFTGDSLVFFDEKTFVNL